MKPELLSPVGNFVSLRSAVKAKADSVYFGIKGMNMRKGAKNFTISDLKKITKYCHDNNVKAYLTVNTIIYENELKKVEKILKKAKEAKIDAIICWDLSVIKKCKELKLEVHLSTQASVSNFESALFYYKLGVERIVLARECALEDIKKIISKIKKKRMKLEIETFVHGAMCVSVSGRCFMSQELFGKSANRGECIQPCRRDYSVTDEEGKQLRLENNYIMSPKDLCVLPFLDKLKKAGIHAFKIEGRNRSPEYVKTVTAVYREGIDNKLNSKKIKELMDKLKTVYNRGFSSGFYMGRPIKEFTDSYGSKATKKKKYIGKVINYYNKVKVAEIKIESEEIKIDDDIMIQGNKTGVFEQKVISMEIEGKEIKKVKKGNNVGIKVNEKLRKNDKVYVIR